MEDHCHTIEQCHVDGVELTRCELVGLLALAELDHLGQVRDGQSSARRARRGVSRPDGAESLRGGGSPATRSWTSLEMTSPSVAPVAELCTPSPRRPPCIFSPRGIVPRYRRVFFLPHLLAATLPEAVLSGGAAGRRFARCVVGQWGGAGDAVCEDHLTVLSRTSACNNGLAKRTKRITMLAFQ